MTLLSGVPGVVVPRPDGSSVRADDPAVDTGQTIRDTEDLVVALRREAVTTVVRQGELKARLVPLQERATGVEHAAALALERGDELGARRMLSRDIWTLLSRDALAEELLETQRLTIRLLKEAVRLQDRARREGRVAGGGAER
jgi:phage shock protein A